MNRLAVIGLTARDRVDDHEPSTGGAPVYCLRGLRQVGASARVATKLAKTDVALLEPLHALSDEIAWRPAVETAEYALDYPAGGGERTVSVRALGEPWEPAQLKAWVLQALTGCELVHAGALSAGDFPASSIALLAEHHRLSLDGQGLVRPARKGPVSLEAPESLELLEHASVLKLSEEEAEVLDVEPTATSMTSLGVPELVLTTGERSALILAHGAVVEIKTEPVPVRDATGAGDAFIACYLHARLGGARGAEAGTFAAEAVAAMFRGREART